MKVYIGIDIGGSSTKIAGFNEENNLIGTLQVRAADQITSLYGALGHFLHKYSISIKNISKIILTGVGASFIKEDIYGIPTLKVPEFEAIGHGGLNISELKEAFIVSMGTGTAIVRATSNDVKHIGGSGIGGGTLSGLSSKLLRTNDILAVTKLAENGDLSNIDLSIQDIYRGNIPSLPPDLTASNFGKIKNNAADSDIALGLINMVLQTIGVLAVFACQNDTIKDIVLVGALSTLPQADPLYESMSNIYGVRFIIPPKSVYATVIGAVIPYLQN